MPESGYNMGLIRDLYKLEKIIKTWVSMDEEFIFQVTEEELAQFPEEGNQSEEEQNQQEYKQGLEIEDKAIQESTEKQYKENNKVKIPSLLDLKLPRRYAASRNGRWNKGTSAEKKRRRGSSRRRGRQSSPQPRSGPAKQPRWGQPSSYPK